MEAKPSPVAQELLSRAFSPETAESIFTERVQKRPLLLRPTINDVSDGREARQRARAESRASHAKALPKPKPLTAREIRASNIYKIPAEARKYEIYKPLHTLWQGYIQEVLGGASSLPINATTAGRLCSADFHGAEVEVVRSRCVGRVGLKGIVLKDTKFTFEIITSADIIKTLPKEYTVFRFEVPSPISLVTSDGETAIAKKARPLVFELHGSQFKNRATDRANKKFKFHNLPDL